MGNMTGRMPTRGTNSQPQPVRLTDQANNPIGTSTNPFATTRQNLTIIHYSDSTYDYFCFANPGTSSSANSWLIKRITSDGSLAFAGGAATFVNAATNLAAVQGYSYS